MPFTVLPVESVSTTSEPCTEYVPCMVLKIFCNEGESHVILNDLSAGLKRKSEVAHIVLPSARTISTNAV